jgi:hypothetical protein
VNGRAAKTLGRAAVCAAIVAACACLAAVSTFSSANGLVAWLVLPPALLAARPNVRAAARGWLSLWCVGFALCAAAYFHGYQHPGSHPETSEALRRPLDAILYFVAYTGGPLAAGRRPLLVALAAGANALAHVAFFALILRHSAADWRRMMLRGKACVLFIAVVPGETCQPEGHFFNPGLMRERAESLDRLGYLRPPLVKETRINAMPAGEGCAEGSFKLLPAEGGGYVAEGEARLPRRGGDPADAVVLASGPTDEGQTAFALATVNGTSGRDDAGWRKTLAWDALPPSSNRLTAWAFDAEQGKVYKLCGARALALPR